MIGTHPVKAFQPVYVGESVLNSILLFVQTTETKVSDGTNQNIYPGRSTRFTKKAV